MGTVGNIKTNKDGTVGLSFESFSSSFIHPIMRPANSDQWVYIPTPMPMNHMPTDLQLYALQNPEGDSSRAPDFSSVASHG